MITKPTVDTRWASLLTNAGATGNPNKIELTPEFKDYGQPEEEPTDRQSLNYVLDAHYLWNNYFNEWNDTYEVVIPATSKQDFHARAKDKRESLLGSGILNTGRFSQVANTEGNIINSGFWNTTDPSQYTTLRMGRQGFVGQFGDSPTPETVINVNGITVHLEGVRSDNTGDDVCIIDFPEAPDGTKTYDTSTGVVVQHPDSVTAFAAETATNKVIISRRDLVFLEVWAELISEQDKVHYRGCVQSGISDPYGLSATLRDDGYTRLGEWDTTTTGYELTWSALTSEEKYLFLEDEKNNIYYDSEAKDYVQYKYRIRVIEGCGHDWESVRPTPPLGRLRYDNISKKISGRGKKIPVSDFALTGTFWSSYSDVDTALISQENEQDYGLFTTRGDADTSSVCHEGRMYAIPLALFSRLNKGAFHPSYNPLGTTNVTGDSGFELRTDLWWGDSRTVAITSTAQCFELGNGSTLNVAPLSGSLSGGVSRSGRDGEFKYHDIVYLDFIEDLTVNSNPYNEGVLLKNIQQKSIKGEVRGIELLPFTKIFNSVGDVTSEYTVVNQDDPTSVVAETYVKYKIGSNRLNWVDLIGVPSNIKATFPEGVVGKWIDTLPSGQTGIPLNRGCMDNQIISYITSDNGSSWSRVTNTPVDTVGNVFTGSWSSSQVSLNLYSTDSTFTIGNDTLPSLFTNSIVHFSSRHEPEQGNRLFYSVLKNIGKSDNINGNVTKTLIKGERLGLDGVKTLLHDDTILESDNNTKGFKTYITFVNKDGLIHAQYLSQELIHDALSFSQWGDTLELISVDGETNIIDRNGNSVKVTNHITSLPIGLVNNNKVSNG